MLISALCGVQLNLKVKPNTEKQYCKQSCAIIDDHLQDYKQGLTLSVLLTSYCG